MKALRRLGFALWLALALVAGQHIAALHDLGHATEKLSQKDIKPAPSKCGECFACAQLVGGAPAALVVFVLAPDLGPVASRVEPGAPAAIALAYRSQAPPALL